MKIRILKPLLYQRILITMTRNRNSNIICPCKSLSTYCRLNQMYTLSKTARIHDHPFPTGVSFPNYYTNNLRIQMRHFATDLPPEEFAIRVTVTKIRNFLQDSHLPFIESHTCFQLQCPCCSRTHKSPPKPPEMGNLYINMHTGMFICYSCKQSGNFRVFVDYINVLEMQSPENKEKIKLPLADNNYFLSVEQKMELTKIYDQSIPLSTYEPKQLQDILTKFKLKGLLVDTLKKFQIRITLDESSILFPFYDHDKNLASIKFHTFEENENIKETMLPKIFPVALFGYSQIGKSHREVVLTASPADALAVYQETNTPAIALPQGVKNLSPEVLPLFEKFQKITLWLGNSIKDWEMSKVFARKLREKRCSFIRPREDQPAPLTGLQQKLNLLTILRESQPISHKSITTFQTLRQDVLDELSHKEQVAGMKWKRFPGLNRLLKGHRRGELTVFTGPTGSGKTTFMSEYSLDLCTQGMSTLWGSFEIKNVRLAKMMLTQYSLLPLDKHLDQFDFWADKFEELPLYLMTFHGQQSIPHVLDAMSHAVYVHDIQHVIVDNVQFMLGVDASSSKLDRFFRQDLLISAFRKFATHNNCHVSLVIHPRKEKEMEELGNSSIFGGAKASQEADNIIILQDKRLSMLRGKKYLQVTKNRFDGDIGIMPLEFDKETLSFAIKKKQIKKINETQSPEAIELTPKVPI